MTCHEGSKHALTPFGYAQGKLRRRDTTVSCDTCPEPPFRACHSALDAESRTLFSRLLDNSNFFLGQAVTCRVCNKLHTLQGSQQKKIDRGATCVYHEARLAGRFRDIVWRLMT